ncbi:MAG TPA: CmcJ/NvfI family oxidoreductase [Dongiaceae bacterium]|nr:CmcJ/NvfI family oxidoreductase [Dongiaceae bacterium]
MAVAASLVEDRGFEQVEGVVTYLVDTGVRPVSYNYDPPPGVPQRTGKYEEHRVPVWNGRLAAEPFSLDRQGFELSRHRTAVADFYDPEEVERVYYAEVEQLLKQATGAEKILTFDHTLRVGPARQRKGLREPVRRAHNDYTEKSGPQRVRDLLPPEEAEERLKRRFAIINTWRPIRGPVEEAPLALCDARSIAPRDLVATDLLYPDRTGEVYSLAFNPAHRWVYFPLMQPDEVVFIKCYDSEKDGRARFAAHSAFDDPTGPRLPAPRESIETRSLVFFPAGA